ncbi:MAG: hypothetical protein A2511_04245 [Deltaproteobacteria bacterium RIFOXYD12_FULL_50_9]|nr:MAG: hypothetical protein A2511_04245 [Deltaproteobacteria bacterium RIFOXYD12_FULL_50_9]
MGEENRVLKRRHLIFYLEVYDDQSGELVGHVVDVTTKGIKLVSKNPIPDGKLFRLRMALPEGYFAERELRFAAQSLWSDNDINPDFYDTGFALQDAMDPKTAEVLATLINQLGFNDSP